MNWELIGQSVLALGLAAGGAIKFWSSYRDSDAVRRPPQDEVTAVRELRDLMQRNHTLTSDDLRDIIKALDRIETSLRISEAINRGPRI